VHPEIRRLDIAQRCRRYGIGQTWCVRLLDEPWAGHRQMLLDTGDWLVPALALYRALASTEVQVPTTAPSTVPSSWHRIYDADAFARR
jgi:hypothetical protein